MFILFFSYNGPWMYHRWQLLPVMASVPVNPIEKRSYCAISLFSVLIGSRCGTQKNPTLNLERGIIWEPILIGSRCGTKINPKPNWHEPDVIHDSWIKDTAQNLLLPALNKRGFLARVGETLKICQATCSWLDSNVIFVSAALLTLPSFLMELCAREFW